MSQCGQEATFQRDETVKTLLVSIVTVSSLLTAPACGASGAGAPPGPPAPPPPIVVSSVIDPNYHFVIQIFDIHAQPKRGGILRTIAGIQQDGLPASWVDKETGNKIKGPLVTRQITPDRYTGTLGPGVVSLSVTANYYGNYGDILQCVTIIAGQTVHSMSRQVSRKPKGTVIVHCVAP